MRDRKQKKEKASERPITAQPIGQAFAGPVLQHKLVRRGACVPTGSDGWCKD